MKLFSIVGWLLVPAVMMTPPLAGDDGEERHDEGGALEELGDGYDGYEEAERYAALGPPTRLRDVRHGSLLLRTVRSDVFLPAPTVATEVTIRVTGPIARVGVRQRFHNPTDDWLEGVYVFPLPETAAVDRLRMIVGERVIEGEIHEREEAKRVFAEAKRAGKKASLVEQERPNVFTNSVANIGPDETIEVEIEYQQEARYDGGRFMLRFPMVVAPRYHPGGHGVAPGGAGDVVTAASFPGGVATTLGAAAASVAVNAAVARLDSPVCPPDAGPANRVELRLELDAGVPLAKLGSVSHAVDLERDDDRYVVTLAGDETPANRDFVFEWQPAPGSLPQSALFTEERGGETYALLMVLPPHGEEAGRGRLPRETIFVVDTSGSMNGESIRQARRALSWAVDRLQPEDHFNVIRFSDRPSILFDESVPASPDRLDEARARIGALTAGGGTEMLSALALALEDSGRDLGVRQVIFITDGAVSDEDRLFAHIAANLGRSRLFTVGIGSAPNSHFMRKAAEHGRGTFTHIGSIAEVEERMGLLLRKLDHPVLTDVAVAWGDVNAESWPRRSPDLYLGEPLVIAARLPGGDVEVALTGIHGGESWQRRFAARKGFSHSGVEKLWARRKIAGLMDGLVEGVAPDEVRRQVIELGLHHHLVSRYTSLVAVDVTPTAPAGVPSKTRRLPVDLPDGWVYESAVGALPSTATPAPLLFLIGVASALLALVLSGRRKVDA